MAGAAGALSASHRLLSLCSSSLTSPYTGNLSVLWCYWSKPVGLSAGKGFWELLGAWCVRWTLRWEHPSPLGTANGGTQSNRAWRSQTRFPSPKGSSVSEFLGWLPWQPLKTSRVKSRAEKTLD